MYSNCVRCGLLLLVLALTSHSLCAQGQAFVPSNDIQLTIWTDSPTFAVGEQIRVRYRIRNVSNGAVFVPRDQLSTKCPPIEFFSAWLEDSRGNHIIGGIAGDCSPTHLRVAEQMSKDAVLLKPGESRTDRYYLHTRAPGNTKDALKPGRYRLEAVLYGWDPRELGQADRSQLVKLGHPFLRGEVTASTVVTLKARAN